MDTIKTPPKKKRRNMGQFVWFHDWLTRRMNAIWPGLPRRDRFAQMAHMAQIDPEKLYLITIREAKPTRDEFMRLCRVTGYDWEQISDLIWNPTPEEPLWS